MSNNNFKQQYQYNVGTTWPAVEPTNVEDFLKQFIKLSYSGQTIECHGASQNWGCIRSSLDIRSGNNKIPIEQRTTIEKSLLESFAKEADTHFSPGAHRHIDIAFLKWGTFRNTGTAFVGRHYGLPTRCVDWTLDPFIALFFACRRDLDNPGVVWWMDYKNFSDAVASQWMPLYGKKGNIADDFEQDFVSGNNKEILSRFHYPDWMERPIKQKAHITLSGQYEVHHDEAIYRLGVRKCGRIIISSQMKSDLLNKLNRWGINGATLGIDDGEFCLETIATDVADKFGLTA
jgi:hypothetical protein